MLNFFKKTQKRKKSAFSMIELSIVLAIIAVIISGSITVSTTALKNAKVKNTKERLEVIKEAMNLYVFNNNRLPCPASLDAITTDSGYGTEVGTAGTCTGTGIYTSTEATANEGIIYGAIPVVDLGLDPEFLGDGFDNKFSYIVPDDLTAAYDPSDDSPLGLEGTNPTGTSGLDTLTVTETISSSDITTEAAYIILSHGPNGYGAFNINGTSNTAGSGVNDEDDNEETTTFNDNFVIRSSDSSFDDILIYDLKENIVKESLGFYKTVCDVDSYDSPNCSGTDTQDFPISHYYESVTINCSGYTNCNGGTATRTCGPNGVWQDVDDNCTAP